jgi:hypothetical protein
MGGVVLVDGFRGRMGFGEALDKVVAMASIYNPVAVGVEKWGTGASFKNVLLFTSNLNVIPLPEKGTPTLSKGGRFETELAPMFTTSRMYISDVETDFISSFKQEWVSWNGSRTATGFDDSLDAVYWAAHATQPNLISAPRSSTLTYEKLRPANPYRT